MAYNTSQYWVNKNQRAQTAKEHTEQMDRDFFNEIEDCVAETFEYSTDFKTDLNLYNDRHTKETNIILCDLDSVSAIFEYKDEITAVLNFSSYKNPGGMFMKGSKAQEECLCHESYLYNVLREMHDFYAWNNQHKNKALYLNRALYTESVLFERDDQYAYCDVLTCAAPNKTAAQKYCNVSDKENSEVLKSRINFVMNVAAYSGAKTLILGAYGCGVFGQNPHEVATIFKEIIDKYPKVFKTIVFAIPNKNTENYKAFKEVFNK